MRDLEQRDQVTIPYEEKFNRNMNTKIMICYGASLSVLFNSKKV